MSYSNTTLGTLRARVRERLLSQFWSDTELNLYINESLRVWNVLTGYARNNQTKSVGSNTIPFYSKNSFTDTGILLLRIETGSTHISQITMDELGAMSINWMTNTATAPSNWFHTGHNIIAVVPIPTIGWTATTYYIDTMTVPASDSDFIQVGDEDLSALIDYITFVARLKEGGLEVQDALPLLQNFLKQAAKYNSKLVYSSVYRRVLGLPYQKVQRPDPLLDQSVR